MHFYLKATFMELEWALLQVYTVSSRKSIGPDQKKYFFRSFDYLKIKPKNRQFLSQVVSDECP